jgi:DNA-binding HxlR family transcriptional regulator
MALLDLVGRRWALRIIWELREGPLTFRALRTACGEISPSVLNDRLAELRAAGVVAPPGEAGYALTDEGRALIQALGGLQDWAERWARRVLPE